MPAHYQGELRGLTWGAGTPYEFSGPIGGLGLPVPRSSDQERGDRDGDVGGDDTYPRRILTFPLNIDAATPAATMQAAQALKRAWQKSPVDVALDLCLPGFPSSDEVLRFYGRPRPLDLDLTRLKSSHADALATFEALDPFGYGPEETVALVAGANVVTNAGDATTDRWTLTLNRTGAASSIDNATDDEPTLGIAAGSSTLILDGRLHTITEAGTDVFDLIQPGYGWPLLLEGDNAVTLTGATGSITFRPAYH